MQQLGIFRDSRLVELVEPADADTETAYKRLNELAQGAPGYGVLLVCPQHPTMPAVDCLDCWPEDGEDPR